MTQDNNSSSKEAFCDFLEGSFKAERSEVEFLEESLRLYASAQKQNTPSRKHKKKGSFKQRVIASQRREK